VDTGGPADGSRELAAALLELEQVVTQAGLTSHIRRGLVDVLIEKILGFFHLARLFIFYQLELSQDAVVERMAGFQRLQNTLQYAAGFGVVLFLFVELGQIEVGFHIVCGLAQVTLDRFLDRVEH